MGFFRIKRDAPTILFSKYIRERDNWTCQRCGRKFEPGDGRLGNSHFFKRAIESTAFDPDNCDSFCNMPCHSEWEHEKFDRHGNLREYGLWKQERLGLAAFTRLQIRAATRQKKDRKMSLLVVRQMMKDLMDGRRESVIGAKA